MTEYSTKMIRLNATWISIILSICVWNNYVTSNVFDEEDDKIVLTDEIKKVPIIKYQYVAVMFCRAMDSKLKQEWKLWGYEYQPEPMPEILSKIENFHIENDEQPTATDFTTLFEYAESALLVYKKALIGDYYKFMVKHDNQRDYVTTAYFFGLLQWIKFNMRDALYSSRLEQIIDGILTPNEDESQPFTVLEDILPEWNIEEECLKVNHLKDLKEFGVDKREQIVEFLQFLAPDDEITMEYCEDVDLYKNFLLETSRQPEKFRMLFKNEPHIVLVYVFDEMYKRCNVTPKPVIVEEIQLTELEESASVSEERVQYLYEVLILFTRVGEYVISLSSKVNTKNMEYKRRLEHFLIDGGKFAKLEYDALTLLVIPLVDEYRETILRILKRNNAIADSLKPRYFRLIDWITQHSHKAMISSVTPPIPPQEEQSKLFKFDERYLKIRTYDDLKKFCETGELPATSTLESTVPA